MIARPRLRPDLVLVEQTYRGEQSFVVKDPETKKYFRFRPVEMMVMQALDGDHTPVEAAALLAESGLRVSAQAVEGFAQKLRSMGLIERTLGERSVLLMERLRAQRRRRLSRPMFKGDLFRLRWSLGDPDRFMDRSIPYLRFFFTREFVLVSLALFALYFVVLALKWNELAQAFSALLRFDLSAGALLVFWLTGTVIIAIHELGHGYTCKHFGGQVHEIGAMLFYFEPAFFCNVNDAWTFPDRGARLWVTAAGSWIQMVLAGAAAVVWWAAEPGTLISQVALAAVIVGGITTVLMNVNPLVPLDGYYALSDWLEVPNLRQRAFAHLGWLIKSRVLRLEAPAQVADEREQRIFLLYGMLAAGYLALTFLFLGAMVFGWLDSLLGAAGLVVFLVLLWVAFGSTLRQWGRVLKTAWHRHREATGWRKVRDRVGLAAVVLLVAGALIPRPITVTGPFAAAPALSIGLTAPDSGVVHRVYVREGTLVGAGTPVLEIRDLELERRAAGSKRLVDSLTGRESQARALGRTGEVARLRAERATAEARLSGLLDELRMMVLRAPSSGVLVTPHPEELVGKWVGLGEPLLELGLPDSLEARIALTDAGAGQVRQGQPVDLVFYADGAGALRSAVTGVAPAASSGAGVEARVGLGASAGRRAGMTGEASVTLRRSNLWGSFWWGVRRRIRSDLLL
jgi:putative peptide zinc metalloprotease protein